MNRLKCVILLLFVFSIFGSVFAQNNRDYDLWYKEHEWLMLKQEKKDWKSLQSNQAKEEFIERFFKARDPDTFTFRNEFKNFYQTNLEKARKDFSDFKDSRRYIYLLFGEPVFRRQTSDQLISFSGFDIKFRIANAEIWKYIINKQNFQVIFAKISTRQLQLFKDQLTNMDNDSGTISPISFSSQEYEILYIGPDRYSDILAFFENFFQENFQLESTENIIKHLKEQITNRAEDFYKWKGSEVNRSPSPLNGMQILLDQFNPGWQKESGLAIWISLDKSFLINHNQKKEYRADISLYCEIRDSDNNRIIYYQDKDILYNLKERKDCLYHFWGTLPPGKYKLILEISENIGKRYNKVECDLEVIDYSASGLMVSLLVGKLVNENDERIKGKRCYLSFGKEKFYPTFIGQYFKDDDELVVFFDIAGFQKNLYGNPLLEISLLFVKVKFEQKEYIPTGEAYAYKFQTIEKDGDRLQGFKEIKIKELVEAFKLSSDLYQVKLIIEDKIANYPVPPTQDYPYPILILSASGVNNLNNSIKRMK